MGTEVVTHWSSETSRLKVGAARAEGAQTARTAIAVMVAREYMLSGFKGWERWKEEDEGL